MGSDPGVRALLSGLTVTTVMSWTFRNTINPSHGLAMQVGQLLPQLE